MKSEIIKVLQVTGGGKNFGGVEAYLLQYCNHIDSKKIHMDFLFYIDNSFNEKQAELPDQSHVFVLYALSPVKNGLRNYLSLLIKLNKFLDEHHYDIIHVNESNFFAEAVVSLICRKRAITIAHSHNTKAITTTYKMTWTRYILKKLLEKPCRRIILRCNDYYFACSNAAGINLFGKSILNSSKYHLIHNAIVTKDYIYNVDIRNAVNYTEKVPENTMVFGYVGRLVKQKNLIFLIDVFREIHNKKANTVLWVIGDGILKSEIEKYIRKLELSESVKLFGERNDVKNLLQRIDAFLLPSLYEGLSVVSIEAQAAGIPVYASNSISDEHNITNLIKFIDLNKGPKLWADFILEDICLLPPRRDMSKEIKLAGYDIEDAGKYLEDFYIKTVHCFKKRIK